MHQSIFPQGALLNSEVVHKTDFASLFTDFLVFIVPLPAKCVPFAAEYYTAVPSLEIAHLWLVTGGCMYVHR